MMEFMLIKNVLIEAKLKINKFVHIGFHCKDLLFYGILFLCSYEPNGLVNGG